MNRNGLPLLIDIFEFVPIKEAMENSRQIYCEFEVSEKSEDDIEKLFRAVATTSQYIQTFAVRIQHDDDTPPTELLRLRGGELQTSGSSGGDKNEDWFQEFKKAASFYSSDEQFQNLAQEILSIERPNGNDIIVDFQLQKETVEQEILSTIDGDPTQQRVSVWSDQQSLQNWIRKSKVVDVVTELFACDKIPIFVLLQQDEGELSSSNLIRIEPLNNINDRNWKEAYEEYNGYFKEIEGLFTDHPPLPAKLFDSDYLRDYFEPLYLYAVFGAVAGQIEISPQNIRVSIESEKRDISTSISLSGEVTSEDMAILFDFYSTFIERGGRESYRRLWHRAIVEYCSSPIQIAEYEDEIKHYYRSLEQNAIEGNFTELSGAVQDAQVFIGDVTNTLSDSTVNTTNEIQKIVIALFTVIVGNLFLLVRNTSLIESATFTTVFSAGLLLLYFPTAQEKVNELSSIIEEGKSDADLYSDLVRNVGADELVDLGRFKDRQEAYIKLANSRVDWAEKRLLQAFVLFILAWCLTAAYTLLSSSLTSTYSIVVGSTAIVSLWIGTKQTPREYQPAIEVYEYQVGAGLVPLAIMGVLLIGIQTI